MAFIIKNGVLKRYQEEEGVTEIAIPEGVTSIGRGAFNGSTNLISITIPDGVTEIDYAFLNCDNLTSIKIGAGITSLDTIPVYNDKVTEIHVSEDNCIYSSIDGVVFNKEKTELIRFPSSKAVTEYCVPEGVTSIAAFAFYGCKKLKNIEIPNTVRTIGRDAFKSTKWLKTFKQDFVIVNGILIKYAGKEETVTIPEGVTCIAGGAFKGNKTLQKVVIPDGVTSIMDSAFDGCKLLSVIHFPESLETVAGDAFEKTEWIKKGFKGNYLTVAGVLLKADKGVTNVKISDDITIIAKGAFTGCRSIQSISVGKGLKSAENLPLEKFPKKVTVSEDNEYLTVVDGVLFRKDMKTLYYYPSAKTDSEYTIPDGVTEIRRNAFVNCVHLHTLTIPETVTTIHCMAFDKCDGLVKVHISDFERWLSLRKSCGYLSGTNPMEFARYLILNDEIIQDTYKDEIIRSYLWKRESWIAQMRRRRNS